MSLFKKIFETSLPSKAPRFWTDSEGLGQILLPLSLIYFLVKRLLALIPVEESRFKMKVICIGNITAGGTGKTPTSIALSKFIKLNFPDKKIAFVTTGYKGKSSGPLLVSKTNTPEEVGDEAFMLSNHGDSIMCKSRLKACKYAEELGYDIVLLDDGLHDRRIKKDLSLCVIDSKYGLGNGLVMPAGPLRDRPDFAIHDATDILMIGEPDPKLFKKLEKKTRKNLELSIAEISLISEHDKQNLYFAFAGIGRPEKFYDTLKKEGLAVVGNVNFPDHHHYIEDDIEYVKNLSESQKAELITTEKDFIKLPEEMKNITECAKIELKIKSGNLLNKIKTLIQ